MDDWKGLAQWLWIAVSGLAWWVWKKQDRRIDRNEERMDAKADVSDMAEIKEGLHSLRNKVVTREDFRTHEERDDNERKERREDIKELFGRIDGIKDDIGIRFDAIRDLLIERKP